MIKLKKPEIEKDPSLFERLSHSQVFLEIYEKKNIILASITIVILLVCSLFWWFHSSEKDEIQGYLNASSLAKKLKHETILFEDQKQQVKTNDEIFQDFEKQYRLNKMAQDTLKGILVEEYLLHGKNKEALLLFSALIDQLKASNLNIFADFDQIVFLIAQNNFDKAYELTKTLEQNKDKAKLPFFSGMVLLYKATLESKLAKKAELAKTIIDLQNLSKGGYAGFSEADVEILAVHLQEGDRNILNGLKK